MTPRHRVATLTRQVRAKGVPIIAIQSIFRVYAIQSAYSNNEVSSERDSDEDGFEILLAWILLVLVLLFLLMYCIKVGRASPSSLCPRRCRCSPSLVAVAPPLTL